MSMIQVDRLLNTPAIVASDVLCPGGCGHDGAVECAHATRIVFPYRGVYVRHVGRDAAVADANQVLFFNEGQDYMIRHPQEGADACLSLSADPALLDELVPAAVRAPGSRIQFLRQQQRLDPQAQLQVVQLRCVLRAGTEDPLRAESLALALLRTAVGRAPEAHARATHARRRLADRVKLTLSGDLARRWTLADIARETGGSPVYLTQVFQQVEGMPLYRYQLQLRLARALALMDGYDDLSALGHDLGFSSHSHFSASFRQAYGLSPSAFRKLHGR
jgi:AraC-like DNA-binding protein